MIKECGEHWCLYSKDGNKLLGKHKTKDDAHAQERAIEASKQNTIKDREIFAVGKHNGDEYTENDIDAMIEAFKDLDFKPALKLGHSKDVGAPAYGYVDNLRKAGGKLIADLIDLPSEIYAAIKEKRYGRVSAEVFWNLERNGKKYKRAISAVALLGQEIPAVAGLKPLYEFTVNDVHEKFLTYEFCFNKTSNGAGTSGNSNTGDGKGVINMDELEKAKAELAAMQETLKSLTAKAEAGEAQAKEYKSKHDENSRLVADLNARLIAKDIDDKVSQLKLPALKSEIKALYTLAFKSQTEVLKVYSVESKKDEDVTPSQVVDGIVKFLNGKAEMFTKEFAAGDGKRSEGYEDPSAEVVRRTETMLNAKEGMSYSEAQKAVLAADPELKKAYAAI